MPLMRECPTAAEVGVGKAGNHACVRTTWRHEQYCIMMREGEHEVYYRHQILLT